MQTNEQNFKHGDQIRCLRTTSDYVTKGKIYTFDQYLSSGAFTNLKIKGTYDNGKPCHFGMLASRFELVEKAVESTLKPAPVKPKDDRKKYTLVYNEHIINSFYIPRIKKIKVKDIEKYLKKCDFDVWYVIKGHVTLV